MVTQVHHLVPFNVVTPPDVHPEQFALAVIVQVEALHLVTHPVVRVAMRCSHPINYL
jgi:hypothetical protein